MAVDTVVLVHGAWHGGWCWDRVRPLLERGGLHVATPTLTNLGDDGEGAPPASLAQHVDDVVASIEATGADRVLLVGHSYGGMPVTGAADRLRNRVAHLMYLDAAVPAAGDSFASHIPGIDAESVARREGAFKAMAGGGAWLPPPPFEMIGISDEADKAWLSPRLRPHPLRTWLDPLRLSATGTAGIPKTYVMAADPPTTLMGYPLHGERAKLGGDWTYRDVANGHELMVVEPERIAALILEAAGR